MGFLLPAAAMAGEGAAAAAPTIGTAGAMASGAGAAGAAGGAGLLSSLGSAAAAHPFLTAMLGQTALSDVMGAFSRANQASTYNDLLKRALSPGANKGITQDVLTALAQHGVSADSGAAGQWVAKALEDAQLQRLQTASQLVPPVGGSTDSMGPMMYSLAALEGLKGAL